MKNLDSKSCVISDNECDDIKDEITRCQGRDENNLSDFTNILMCSNEIVTSFNILKNPLNSSSLPNPYYTKALFGERNQMNNHTDDSCNVFCQFDNVSVARKGSLNEINDDKRCVNNYKTWPERCDKAKDHSETKSQLDSVNIHINNGFDLGENNLCEKESARRELKCRKGEDLRGCLDMSNNGGCPQGTMRLSQALDSISLAYNPITKQLHFVSPKNPEKNRPSLSGSDSESKKGSFSDEGNYSLSNGDKSDSLSSESPRNTLIRPGHKRGTDQGSFSSTVSSLSEGSIGGDAQDDLNPPDCLPKNDAAKGKKKSLASFFSRGVFPWRSAGHSAPCTGSSHQQQAGSSPWRLFGGRSSAPCAPASEAASSPSPPPHSASAPCLEEAAAATPSSSGASTPRHRRPASHHTRQGSTASCGEGKLFDDLVASSVALIQHNRPSNLPAKDEAEESRHRQEYQRMVEAARRREAREARERKRQLARQVRHEEGLSAALREWNNTILPAWDTMKNSRKTKELWWCGIPPAVRGKVWQLAIPNNLNITPQLYHICVERAKQKLIQVKFKKNGYKTADTSNQDEITKRLHPGDCDDKIKKDKSKQNGICVNGEVVDDKNRKLSNIIGKMVKDNPNSPEVRLGERLSKDLSKMRNYSEQNLTKRSVDNDDDKIHGLAMKASQSDPDLCEYSNEPSMELIQLDISRTFPNLCIFQPGGPYFDVLHQMLAAYVCYRPDVGYVQGMSFLAAVLILNMEAAEAFVCFANLLNGPVLRAAFTLDASGVQALWAAHLHLLGVQLPSLRAHHSATGLGPELYLLEWLYSGFAKAMPLDVVCRVWDVFLRDGEEFLFRTALGVLHLYQEELLQMDFITASQFLTKLPEDLSSDALFKSISCINMTVDKLSFQQLVEKYKEEGCTVLGDEEDTR